ncbi:hypothetical protein THAOC_00494 [Thalassiosira oceanica]|uniref:Uncharacterized protein n=1 Tax=Thalassiosira oceanica TaxID=159749 RepID=K0TRE6_THAOC|nr:hypothetical protein THAOC_00494 [Thalassiosira oceanica]|mmetsp:Transcript_7529/g.17564  ORF Transcript_7529/g.17564 Transcript_7529/m.17564 type:complete len:257 (-) Transcript_7529:1868-2638(-)|eukprot:EJK77662.1 hypothetical protein THAOC_00494 [Thalassiosira oceanica]
MQRRGGGRTVLSVLIVIIIVTLCGPGATIAVAVGASAAATTNGAPPQTCGQAPDQPQCEDNPAAVGDGPNVDVRRNSGQNLDVLSSEKKQQKRRTNEDEASQSPETRSSQEETTPPIAPSKFNVGDVIELYNTESMDIQIVFPSIVKGIETSPPGGYRVTKTTDGKEVRNIPEKYLHNYQPYKIGAEVLCNIGEFKKSRPIIVRCTVLDYEPATPPRGALVLQGNYRVQVHETKANPAHETTLPVWKLQRRYLASG